MDTLIIIIIIIIISFCLIFVSVIVHSTFDEPRY